MGVFFAVVKDDVAGGVLVLELLLKLVVGHLVSKFVLDAHGVETGLDLVHLQGGLH